MKIEEIGTKILVTPQTDREHRAVLDALKSLPQSMQPYRENGDPNTVESGSKPESDHSGPREAEAPQNSSPSQSPQDRSPVSDVRPATSQSSDPARPEASSAIPVAESSCPDSIGISCFGIFYKFRGKTYCFNIKATSLEEVDERVDAIRAGAVLDPGHRGWGPFEMASMLRGFHSSTNAKVEAPRESVAPENVVEPAEGRLPPTPCSLS